ncbi:hypothetical protein SLEP1_g39428 [Rubroshorea leprosula]|uniref:Uncharacterized protein n=1 Tax=Rubroshorea leprosula TaxID=152421 RepID=A0AAV5L060_9ROSI|nr:hypothetical protein SLEP1_g39428 [Rubroshorea leprosula]
MAISAFWASILGGITSLTHNFLVLKPKTWENWGE